MSIMLVSLPNVTKKRQLLAVLLDFNKILNLLGFLSKRMCFHIIIDIFWVSDYKLLLEFMNSDRII